MTAIEENERRADELVRDAMGEESYQRARRRIDLRVNRAHLRLVAGPFTRAFIDFCTNPMRALLASEPSYRPTFPPIIEVRDLKAEAATVAMDNTFVVWKFSRDVALYGPDAARRRVLGE